MKTTTLITAILKTKLFQLYLPLTLLTYLLITPASWLPAFSELKYPAMAALLLLLTLTQRPILKPTDLAIALIAAFLLFSLIDTRHLSYAWHPLLNWLTLLALAIYIRPFFQQHQHTILPTLQILFALTLAYTLFLIITLYLPLDDTTNLLQVHVGTEKGRTWEWLASKDLPNWFVRGYGKNYNVVATFPTLLSPLVLFHRFRTTALNLAIKIPTLLGLLYLTNYFGSQLSLGLLLIFTLTAIWYQLPNRIALITLATTITALIIATPYLADYLSGGLFNVNHSGRLNLDRLALKVAGHHFLNGSGIGSWYYEVNNYIDPANIRIRLRNPNNTFQTFGAFIHNHNTKFLAEIGPIGFLTYLALPTYFGIQILLKRLSTPQIKYALLFLGWYATATTLRFAVGDDNEISEVQLLGWLGYSWLTANTPSAKISLPRKLPIFLATGFLLFFTFTFYANHQQLKAFQYYRNQQLNEAITTLEKIQIPGLKTTINDLEPIDRHLARWYTQASCPNEALDHYQRVFQRLPDDPGLVAEFLNYAKANQIFISNLPQEIQRYKVNPRMLPLITFQEICRPDKSEALSLQMDTVTNPNLANGGKLTLTGKVQENMTVLSGTSIVLQPGFEVPAGKNFSAGIVICPQ